MTHHDRIKTAIWTPAAITVAVVAAYCLGTDRVSWVGMILCGAVAAVCGMVDYIFERRSRNDSQRAKSDHGEPT